MKLGNKSKGQLLEAKRIITATLKTVSAGTASGHLSRQEADRAAHDLRQAASRLEDVSGRLFYAEQKKGRKK